MNFADYDPRKDADAMTPEQMATLRRKYSVRTVSWTHSDIWIDAANAHESRLAWLEQNLGAVRIQISQFARIGLADTDNVFTNEDEEQRAEHMRGKMEALFVARENEFREVGDDQL